MREGEAGAKAWAERPMVGLRGGAHHLQFAARETARGKNLRIQSFEVRAGTNDDFRNGPFFFFRLDRRH